MKISQRAREAATKEILNDRPIIGLDLPRGHFVQLAIDEAVKEWREVAADLRTALANDGIEANNPLSAFARDHALARYEALKGEKV